MLERALERPTPEVSFRPTTRAKLGYFLDLKRHSGDQVNSVSIRCMPLETTIDGLQPAPYYSAGLRLLLESGRLEFEAAAAALFCFLAVEDDTPLSWDTHHDPLPASILKSLVATGRLFLRDASPPVSLGEPRLLTPAWVQTVNGGTASGFSESTTNLIFFRCDNQLWFVDTAEDIIGEVHCSTVNPLHWYSLPTFRPEKLPALNAGLREFGLPVTGLPAIVETDVLVTSPTRIELHVIETPLRLESFSSRWPFVETQSSIVYQQTSSTPCVHVFELFFPLWGDASFLCR